MMEQESISVNKTEVPQADFSALSGPQRGTEAIDDVLHEFSQEKHPQLGQLRGDLKGLSNDLKGEQREHLERVYNRLVSRAPRLRAAELKELAGIYDDFKLPTQATRLLELLPLTVDNHLRIKPEVNTWFNPLSNGHLTLREVADSLKPIAFSQNDIPLIIQLVENPKYDVPVVEVFPGATDLKTHDYIHIVLGRGLLAKDEAFVIGFTMGSTDKMSSWKTGLYSFIAKNLYPKTYQFSDEDARVFKDAVHLGDISDCKPLSDVDFTKYLDMPISEVRKQLGIEENLLRAYYEIEKRRYPESKESQRLLQ